MSASGVRHFFVLEASEYVERLDELVAAAGDGAPDSEALLRVARALRGASTMARLEALTGLGAAVEKLARSLRDGILTWNEPLRDALLETVADLRELIRNARSWGESEETRAHNRMGTLLALIPVGDGTPAAAASRGEDAPATALAASGGTLHLVQGCGELAAALTAAATRPDDPATLADAIRRIASLRGVAAVSDHRPLGELLDVLETALRGTRTPLPSADRSVLLDAARVLRRASDDMRAGRELESDAEWRAVMDSAAALGTVADERVVPIAQFFHDDGGPHVVDEASHPPTRPLDRFRMESSGQAEHLRRLIAAARDGVDGEDHSTSRIEAALHALRDVALSYGETELARLIATGAEAAAGADRLTLDAIDALASRLLAEAGSVEELCDRLTDLARGHRLAAMIGSGFGEVDAAPTPRSYTPRSATPVDIRTLLVTPPDAEPVAAVGTVASDGRAPTPTEATAHADTDSPPPATRSVPAPAATAAPERLQTPAVRRSIVTPTGADLQAFLADGIAGFQRLEREPLGEPTPVEDVIVSIESLLYDRDGALRRARELRQELRERNAPAPQETLEEIFDLLEMAVRE